MQGIHGRLADCSVSNPSMANMATVGLIRIAAPGLLYISKKGVPL